MSDARAVNPKTNAPPLPGYVFIDVVSGAVGFCLSVGDNRSSHRLAGPKTYGGGSVVHRFQVDVEELVREAESYGNIAEAPDVA